MLRVISGARIPKRSLFLRGNAVQAVRRGADPVVLWCRLAAAECREWGHLAGKLRRLRGARRWLRDQPDCGFAKSSRRTSVCGKCGRGAVIAARDGFPSRAAVP